MQELAEKELARLEEMLKAATQERDALTQQCLRIEGAIVTLRALLRDAEASAQPNAHSNGAADAAQVQDAQRVYDSGDGKVISEV